MWDWKQASKVETAVPKKKSKLSEKSACLQCMELVMKGKREEKFACISRTDATSVNRHKLRWHKIPNNSPCTFVPLNSPEIKNLRERNSEETKTNIDVEVEECRERDDEWLEKPPLQLQLMELSDDKFEASGEFDQVIHYEEMKALQPLEPLDPLEALDSLKPFPASNEATQSTIFSHALKPEAAGQEKNISMKDLMQEISNLSSKIDGIGKQHTSLMQLALEDGHDRKSIVAMQKADNINEMVDGTDLLEWFYDETTECGVLRCRPCFNLQVSAKPNFTKLTPLRSQQLLNPKSRGNLSTGIFLKKEVSTLMIQGKNQTWYRQKKFCLDHMLSIGDGSKTHHNAMKQYTKELEIKQKQLSTASNIFRAAIVDLKLGGAASHFETLIAFLATCSVDVGKIGHGRNNFNDILYCLEKTVNKRISKWLNMPLPSTLLPPHFWGTVDKGTPSRTTNQATIIVARDKSGTVCPIPVDAPKVYATVDEGSYDSLAAKLVQSIALHFGEDTVTRLCGVAADGPYQTTSFGERLCKELSISEDEYLSLPVTWDTAHVLNLAVTDVRDSKSESGAYFRTFIKRCNVFNHILSHGKGFAFLEAVDSKARRPVSYAMQCFANSSYEQWMKIDKSYAAYWKAFNLLHLNRNEEEEWQNMIGGSDFVEDLLGILDIMNPFIDLMSRAQSLDTPIWKLHLWWPQIKKQLQKAGDGDRCAFPKLSQAEKELKPGGSFKGVTL